MQKVIIFGTGNLYKEKQEYISNNFEVVGFLDNKVQNDETMYEDTNIPIFRPENMKKYLYWDVAIVLMSYQYVSMWRQLYELGISKEKILFGIMFPTYTESESALFAYGRHLEIENKDVVYYPNPKEKIIIENHNCLQEIGMELLREEYRKKYPFINAISQMDTKPVSRKFGMERGNAIDRYYIEHFLEHNKNLIYGQCLEIAENTYTLRYGKDRGDASYILHVEGWGNNVIKGNLETGEGIESERYDCAIITQTLMFLFEIKKAATNIYKMLKKGGHALITVAGISQISRYDADLWGSCYGFHMDAMRSLFEPLFGKENVIIKTYGNVKIAVAMLFGLCQEDLNETDFEVVDCDYPVIISVILRKA